MDGLLGRLLGLAARAEPACAGAQLVVVEASADGHAPADEAVASASLADGGRVLLMAGDGSSVDPAVADHVVRLAAALTDGAAARRQADNLAAGLESNRQIGIAIGIVMARELVRPDEAFARLREASQRRHRKLREIAAEVERTGELPTD